MGTFMVKNGERYIRYTDIKESPNFLRNDGVLLTPFGNEIFHNTLHGPFELIIFVESAGISFP